MSFDIAEYRAFIASKGASAERVGFTPSALPASLFEHQRRAVEYACEKGRAALFLETGLGKSRCEAVFADEARRQTNKPSLILTPLAVARQMQRECVAVGVEARIIREDDQVWSGVNIANYERLPKLNASRFGAVVLDESSILKALTGATKTALCAAFAETPYRLAATATPAPNDHMELGNHAEFLGVMKSMEMLCRWFVNDTSKASQEWRLKGHATADFWEWVASWARAASTPSDLGGDDRPYQLKPLVYDLHVVAADLRQQTDGALFRMPDNSATSIHREKKLTINERVGMAAQIVNQSTDYFVVWCERDDESRAVSAAIPDAIEVRGSMDADEKEAALEAFLSKARRVLVTKPRIAGFGLNMQHCHRMVRASITHSYEQHYQLVRRFWRFGQQHPVTADIIMSDTELPIWANIQRKAADHERMKVAMARAMIGAQTESARRTYTRHELTLPQFMRGGASHAT